MKHFSNFIIILCLTVSLVAAVFSADRASGWANLSIECRLEQKVCQYCGSDKNLEGHHRLEFSQHGKYELVKKNVIVLCRDCHLRIGHNGNFKTENPYVKEECDAHREHMKHYAWKITQLEKEFNNELGQTLDKR